MALRAIFLTVLVLSLGVGAFLAFGGVAPWGRASTSAFEATGPVSPAPTPPVPTGPTLEEIAGPPATTDDSPSGSSLSEGGAPATCKPAAGTPSENCGYYRANAYWLPSAFVTNATCLCEALPDTGPGACVRAYLQDHLAKLPVSLVEQAEQKKPLDDFDGHPFEYAEYYARFVHQVLTPVLHQHWTEAFAACCCGAAPRTFASWKDLVVYPVYPNEACPPAPDLVERWGACNDDGW